MTVNYILDLAVKILIFVTTFIGISYRVYKSIKLKESAILAQINQHEVNRIRTNIINFSAELMDGQKKNVLQFDNILDDYYSYKSIGYCEKIEIEVKYIKNEYRKKLASN